jgi:hypothetical protein
LSPVANIKEDFDRAFNLYQVISIHFQNLFYFAQRGLFKEAQDSFLLCLLTIPLDYPSQIFVDRCGHYMREGVPSNWEGIELMSVK